MTREVTTPTNDLEKLMSKKSKRDKLCNEFEDLFQPLSHLQPADRVTYAINLIDKSASMPKPRTYHMSPAELAEVRR